MEPLPTPSRDILTLSDGLLRTVEGTVVEAAPLRTEQVDSVGEVGSESPSQRIDLRVVNIEVVTDDEDRQVQADGALRLTVRWQEQMQYPRNAFHCGEHVRAVARLLPPEEYRDPGAWSRKDYLAEQGVTATASVDIARIGRLGPSPTSSLDCRIATMQRAWSGKLLALPAAMGRLPSPLRVSDNDAVMLAAMTTGDRTFLTHALRVGFERTGSFHMLVVSGSRATSASVTATCTRTSRPAATQHRQRGYAE
jgi:competence protein ComEC